MTERSYGIVVNGDLGSDDFIRNTLKNYTDIICVDGAANRLMELKMMPTIILGDLDSITPTAFEYYRKKEVLFQAYSPCKDETDTQIAIRHCAEQGAHKIDLIGALGSRADHSLANVSLLYWYRTKGITLKLIHENNTLYLLEPGTWVIPEEKDRYLSFLAFGGNVYGITLQGVKYSLINFDLPLGSSRCISNEFQGDAQLSFREGNLLTMLVQKGL